MNIKLKKKEGSYIKKGNIISSAEPTEYQLKINEKLETTDLIFRN